MATASEKRFANWFRDNLKSTRELHMQRIESSTGSGVPDIEGCWAGESFWIELKAVDVKPTKPGAKAGVKIRPAQINWLERRWNVAGNAYILIRLGKNYNATCYLVPGDRAACLPGTTLAGLAKIACSIYEASDGMVGQKLALAILNQVTGRNVQ